MAPLPFCSAPIPRIRTFERRMVLEAQNFNLTRLVCYNCKLSPTSSALQSFQAPSVEKGKGTVSKRLGSRVLHRSLSFGPNPRYVNHKLPGAGGGRPVRRRGPTEILYFQSPLHRAPLPPVSGKQSPLIAAPPSPHLPGRGVAARCCWRTRGCRKRAGTATWRAPRLWQLRFVSISEG